MIAAVRLGGQYGKEAFTIVDLEDLPLALSRKWTCGGGYVVTSPAGDENTLDNRRENLMVCSNKVDANMQPHPRRDAACGGGGTDWPTELARMVAEATAAMVTA